MADGVSRTGLVTEALSGELWWPRPRPAARRPPGHRASRRLGQC